MASKNSIKTYVTHGTYHIYNRGINFQNIFITKKDYDYFLFLLRRYLLKPPKFNRQTNNFYKKIKLLSFTLMPNHFHLQIKQSGKRHISKFMQSLVRSYAQKFNKEHMRVGHVFQDRYKARLLESVQDIINTSKYIHLNPIDINEDIFQYDYSSLKVYTKQRHLDDLIDTKIILKYFNNSQKEYKRYIEKGALNRRGSEPF